jgi:obg-like ATPase 1
VPDDRFDWLVNFWKPLSSVPAVLHVTDIAGLVKGANEGQGLGNAFLSHIKAVDAIFHMLRVFEDEDITHVEGNIDPVRDMEIIHEELQLKDIQFLETRREALERPARNDKAKKTELDVVEKVLKFLKDEKKDVRYGHWNWAEVEFLNQFQLLTAKPVVYLCNCSPGDYIRKKNKWLLKIKTWIDQRSGGVDPLIPFSAAFELEFQALDSDDARKKFEEERGAKTALPRIIHAGYNALHLIHFFTAGKDEVKCWTIRKGTKAPGAGGRIHTDFEKTFINAEITPFAAFKELGSEAECKNQGKSQLKGKDYEVLDGDIIFFKCSAR